MRNLQICLIFTIFIVGIFTLENQGRPIYGNIGGVKGLQPRYLRIANNPRLGPYIVDDNGMSLYLFDNDHVGSGYTYNSFKITCYGHCAMNWPPLIVSGLNHGYLAGPGLYQSLISARLRNDGRYHLTYNNIPLYNFDEDQMPGDIKGHNLFLDGGYWFLISQFGRAIYNA